MKKWMAVLSCSGTLLLAGAAFGQGAAPKSAVDAAMAPETTVTTTTSTSTGGDVLPGAPDENGGTMPATGGAPLAMLLAGSLTAASGLFLRRKLA